jgi:hypothetical protein
MKYVTHISKFTHIFLPSYTHKDQPIKPAPKRNLNYIPSAYKAVHYLVSQPIKNVCINILNFYILLLACMMNFDYNENMPSHT